MNKTELNAVCWAALEAVARKECRREKRDIFGTLSQGWKTDGEDIESMEQIIAERATS